MVYKAQRGRKHLMVRNGVEGKEHEYVDWPLFSPDGQHLAYVARRENENGTKHLMVLDDIEGKEYHDVSRSDSALLAHFGYTTASEQGWPGGPGNPNLNTGVTHGGRSSPCSSNPGFPGQ
jgi:hypothetical protein